MVAAAANGGAGSRNHSRRAAACYRLVRASNNINGEIASRINRNGNKCVNVSAVTHEATREAFSHS